MKNKIFGDIHEFALESTIEESGVASSYGFLKIWIDGNFIGDVGVECYCNSVVKSLLGIARRRGEKEIVPEVPRNSVELLKWLENESSVYNSFLPIAGFDYFLKLYFMDDFHVIFIWGLHPQAVEMDEYKNYPNKIFFKRAKIDSIKKCADQLKEYLNNIKNNI